MDTAGKILMLLIAFIGVFAFGAVTQNNITHKQPIAKCEIENDLPRSQTCEMVVVVKE